MESALTSDFGGRERPSRGLYVEINYGRNAGQRVSNLRACKRTRVIPWQSSITILFQNFLDNFVSFSKRLHVLKSTGHSVGGVTTLGDELFVVRLSVQHVDVYDAATFTFRRRLSMSYSFSRLASWLGSVSGQQVHLRVRRRW